MKLSILIDFLGSRKTTLMHMPSRLYALDASDSIGLIKKDGTERLAFAEWQKLFDEG